jgi:hypothetical protein
VEVLGEQRGAVGGDRGEHDLDEVVVGAAHQVGDAVAEGEPAAQPDRRHPGQAAEAAHRVEVPDLDRRQDGGEGHDRGPSR